MTPSVARTHHECVSSRQEFQGCQSFILPKATLSSLRELLVRQNNSKLWWIEAEKTSNYLNSTVVISALFLCKTPTLHNPPPFFFLLLNLQHLKIRPSNFSGALPREKVTVLQEFSDRFWVRKFPLFNVRVWARNSPAGLRLDRQAKTALPEWPFSGGQRASPRGHCSSPFRLPFHVSFFSVGSESVRHCSLLFYK